MSLDPARTIAAIVGAAEFPNYPSFQGAGGPAFAASAHAFSEFLEEHYGADWRKERLLDLFNHDGGQDDQVTALSEFLARHRDDAKRLIFYYVGHGGLYGQDEYFLALKRTREKFERTSGLGIKALADAVYTSFPGREVFLILDCCFAGKAVDAMMSGDVNERVKNDTGAAFTSGTALLCASSKRDVALSTGVGACTQFTESLVEVLRKGVPEKGELLTLRDMGDAVRERVRGRFGLSAVDPEVHSPRQQGVDVANQPLFANPAFAPPTLAALRPDLAEDLCNEEKHLLREGAARELGRLMKGDDKVLARAAETAIRERLESGVERDRFVYEAMQYALSPHTTSRHTRPPSSAEKRSTTVAGDKTAKTGTPPKSARSATPAQDGKAESKAKPESAPKVAKPGAPAAAATSSSRRDWLARMIYLQIGLSWLMVALTAALLGN